MNNILNQKQIKKWVKALRSGKYKQTLYALNNYSGYCCLGVACKVLQTKHRLNNDGYLAGALPYHQNFYQLSNLAFDLDIKADLFLTEMNDSQDYSFDEIADCLELVYIHKALD